MTAAEVARIASAKQMTGGWKAKCPSHDDQNPSLSISEGEGGRVLLHCFAGCAVDEIVSDLGLEMTDLFLEGACNKDSTERKIVAEYDYVDENGSALYRTVRYHPKDFRQQRADGRGGWIWSLNDVRRVPFKLPQLRDGIARGDMIAVVEGEKDVFAAERLGYVATTNAGGAGWIWTQEFVRNFQGAKRIIVLCDADDAGRNAAHLRAMALARICDDVRVVDFGMHRPFGVRSQRFCE